MRAISEHEQRARRCRRKADECRELAERMSDLLDREAFLEVGKGYDRLADQLEEHAQAKRASRH